MVLRPELEQAGAEHGAARQVEEGARLCVDALVRRDLSLSLGEVLEIHHVELQGALRGDDLDRTPVALRVGRPQDLVPLRELSTPLSSARTSTRPRKRNGNRQL